MGLTTRPSHPALLAARHAIQADRSRLLELWSQWIARRMAQAPGVKRPTVERQLALLLDIIIELAGPLRRQVAELWFAACDGYGRVAAVRGLAAGEVVEELQYLRELLIYTLSETVVLMPPRQSMAVVLRLNRLLDRGVAHAVVGYTDTLVETLLNRRGVPTGAKEETEVDVVTRISQLEEELARLRALHPDVADA